MRNKSKQTRLFFIASLLLWSTILFSQSGKGIWDVFDFGAKGNGKTLDTKAIQTAIDQCHEKGGGKVYLHSGEFVSGTIILKNNVTLYIEAGAVLRGSDNLDDFPIMPSKYFAKYPSKTGEPVTEKMMIYAEDAKNISICGRGVINGNGDHWKDGPYGENAFSLRPRIIHFRYCENVSIKDITLYNSAMWVQHYQSCRNLFISGITVDSRQKKGTKWRNEDGLDIVDCNFVRVSDCFINSGDDAICIKSFSPDESCSNIVITNCVVSTLCNGIKIGTETAGIMEDITIQNCVVYDTSGDGIAIMTVDGARIRRVNISNITMRNIQGSAIFVRLGKRFTTYGNMEYRIGLYTEMKRGGMQRTDNVVVGDPVLKDIIVENIQGTDISNVFGCSLTGMENMPFENITLRNINLTFRGGGKAEDADIIVPENEQKYPAGRMFGKLPDYGFYIRHVRNLVMDNIRLSFAEEDLRPALICDDVSNFELKGLKAEGSQQSPCLIKLVNTSDVIISESYPTTPISVFAEIQGSRSKNIYLLNNRIQGVGLKYKVGNGAAASAVKEFGSF